MMLGERAKLEGRLGNDRQRAVAADVELVQIIARDIFDDAAARLALAAIGVR